MSAKQLALWGQAPSSKLRAAPPDIVCSAWQTTAMVPPAPLPAPRRAVPPEAYTHQVDGVGWLEGLSRGGILADDCGLGKTLQATVAADPPILVVCPAAMRIEWAREMGRWRPELELTVVNGRSPLSAEKLSSPVIVINYDVLAWHVDALKTRRTATLIADEAHLLANLEPVARSKVEKAIKDGSPIERYEGSARARAFVQLADGAGRVFLLTATPMMNRPIELWPLLHYLDPKRWHDYVKFGEYFCGGKLQKIYMKGKNKKGEQKFRKAWNFDGTSNEKKLHRVLAKEYMLRRTKDIIDLPEKSRKTVMVALSDEHADEYWRAEEDFAKWVEESGGTEALMKHLAAPVVTKLAALRKLSATGKLPIAIDWVTKHLASGRPLVVMAHHRDVTCGLAEKLATAEVAVGGTKRPVRVGRIIGGMTEKQRTDDKDAFQRGELDVMVCSIAAAGVGITLTQASDMLFVERAWRPADLVQAEDRIHRIGQKNACSVTYLDASGTIDEVIGRLLLDKRKTFASVVDGQDLGEPDALRLVFGAVMGVRRRQNLRQRVLGLW